MAAGVVTLLLVTADSYVQSLVPKPYHQPVWLTGIILFCTSCVAAVLVRRSSPAKQQRLDRALLTGAVIGALLFVLFISDVECSSTPSARGGTSLSCRYLGDL